MAECQTLAYRAVIDVSVSGQSADAGDLLHLPVGVEDDDQRISLLVASQVLQRAPEHDGTPTRRRRK